MSKPVTATIGIARYSGIPRSNARGSALHRRDAVFVAGTIAVCAVAVAVSVAAGAWHPVFG